jgi:hypothetical protein
MEIKRSYDDKPVDSDDRPISGRFCRNSLLISWRVGRRLGGRGLAVLAVAAAVIGPLRDYRVAAMFPNWITFSPGLAPVLAVATIYALLVIVGHAVMRIVSGPAQGDADNADIAVGFRDVLREPVDGVVGVGGVVDGCRIQRPAEGAVHDVVALGAILAADVLDDADVAAFDDDVRGVVVAVEAGVEVVAVGVGGELRSAVWRTCEHNAGVMRSFGNENDGVQLDAVAHGDHDLAASVVGAILRGANGGGYLRGHVGVLPRGRLRMQDKRGAGERRDKAEDDWFHRRIPCKQGRWESYRCLTEIAS